MSLSFQPALYQNAAGGTNQRQFTFNSIFGAAFFYNIIYRKGSDGTYRRFQ
jgi:hypothetical protein